MSAHLPFRYAPPRALQRGQALLLTVVALAIGFGAVFYSFVGTARQSINYDRITNDALAQAKAALIGYAASDSNRPGSLPCPDTDNDGSAQLFSGSECPSYIGRLPWRTLGLPDLRDGSGETLWYAVTREFARNPSCGTTCPLNSDTKGTLTITGTSPATDIVAVVFAPGPVVGTQERSTANQNTVAHYLEGGNETGIATSTFVTAATTTSFDDRLLALNGADIMTPVERRAAKEILTLLQTYHAASACSCYPWADISNGSSNTGYYEGRVPLLGALPESWGSLGITVPTWLTDNKWWWVFFYTIAAAQSAWHSGGYLYVDSVYGTRVVLITTGPAGTGRPITSWSGDSDWAYYVDDSNNADMGTWFNTPSSTAYGRDRLYTL